MNVCKKCGGTKKHASGQCANCSNEAHKKYRNENREKVLEATRKWRRNNPDKVKKNHADWYKANTERAKEKIKKHREDKPHIRKLWNQKNKDKLCIYSHNRRALVLQSGGKLSSGLFDKLFALQIGKCACCKADLKSITPHMDHIISLTAGGKNEDSNIQLLCSTCNLQKHAKDPIIFMQSKGYLL